MENCAALLFVWCELKRMLFSLVSCFLVHKNICNLSHKRELREHCFGSAFFFIGNTERQFICYSRFFTAFSIGKSLLLLFQNHTRMFFFLFTKFVFSLLPHLPSNLYSFPNKIFDAETSWRYVYSWRRNCDSCFWRWMNDGVQWYRYASCYWTNVACS